MTDAELTGERIAYHRKRLGLSQIELAGLIGRSDSWVSQVERGVRAIDRLSVLRKVADALGVPMSELRGTEPEGATTADQRPEAFETLRLALTGHPAIDIVLGGLPQALTSEHLEQIVKLHQRVWPMVHASQYSELAPLIARLVPELERAIRTSSDDNLSEVARGLLSNTYQAIAAIMAKLGETDAAWIAADRAAFTAETLPNPLIVAASLFRMAHVFLTLGQITQAQAVASSALTSLQERGRREPTVETLSLSGAFHLVLAIAAARDNDRDLANHHLRQAHKLADDIGEDRDDFGTEFGPTNVALHAVGVAVELGDAGQAIELAQHIEPNRLSAERQARYSIDLAQAHAMRRQTGEALDYLKKAEELTPEQTRTHRIARAVARDLIQLSGTRPQSELRELAERFGVLP